MKRAVSTFALSALLAGCAADDVPAAGVAGDWRAYSPETDLSAIVFRLDDDPKKGVCRFEIEGAVLPGTLTITHGAWTCEVSYFGAAHARSTDFEVLAAMPGHVWTAMADGNLPVSPVIGGESDKGDRLYICTVSLDGTHIIGKTRPLHGGCLYPLDGGEDKMTQYRVLNSEPSGN